MQRLTMLLFAGASLAALSPAVAQDKLPQATDSYFTAAQADLARRLAIQPISGKAKNVIIMVGDGMSVATVTAARILEGQKRGVDGEFEQPVGRHLPLHGTRPRPTATTARFRTRRRRQPQWYPV